MPPSGASRAVGYRACRRAFRTWQGIRPGLSASLGGIGGKRANRLAHAAVAALQRRGYRRAINEWREYLWVVRLLRKVRTQVRARDRRRAFRAWVSVHHWQYTLYTACRIVLRRKERAALKSWRARCGRRIGLDRLVLRSVYRRRLISAFDVSTPRLQTLDTCWRLLADLSQSWTVKSGLAFYRKRHCRASMPAFARLEAHIPHSSPKRAPA